MNLVSRVHGHDVGHVSSLAEALDHSGSEMTLGRTKIVISLICYVLSIDETSSTALQNGRHLL